MFLKKILQKGKKMKTKNYIYLGLLLVFITQNIAAELIAKKTQNKLLQGRSLFYQAVENETKIDSALQIFYLIKNEYPILRGRAQVYIGALKAVQAKHTFWPHNKLYYANKGLNIMDAGLQLNPNDIESMFIHGTICYNLPFIFNRSDDARHDFQSIIRLLPTNMESYDEEFIMDITVYLLENIELNQIDKQSLLNIQNQLKSNTFAKETDQ